MRLLSASFLLAALPGWAADWPDYRGPNRDGTSPEKNLIADWSPAGKNLLWKAPYGGRSTPVVMGGRVYVLNPGGQGENLQERLMCLDAATGKIVWERRHNIYLSDVPPHRIAWSSPAADPETGNVYVFSVGGSVLAFSRDGKPLWGRSLAEDFGLVTTHGGRTPSPVVEEDLVIVSGISSAWGDTARATHRFYAFDKRTGETVYVSSPGGRPFDTTYSPPIVAEIDGTRLFIAGGGDGTVHAIKAATGEPVWKYVTSKRGVNTGVVVYNKTAYVSHSEENLDTSEMGLLAAVDATAKGDIGPAQIKWAHTGLQVGFSSPVLDGDRYYQIDNGSNLFAWDAVSGRQLWKKNLGTIQKASPVLADGKLYTGNENGRFYILKPRGDGADVLSQVQLGTEDNPELITASPAISDGRVFVVTQSNIYCFGRPAPAVTGAKPPKPEPGSGPPSFLQVRPADLILKPGANAQLRARLYDANGRFLREAKAGWSLEGVKGNLQDGRFTAPADVPWQAGVIKATAEGVTGAATVRVMPALGIEENFEAVAPGPPPKAWANATGKYQVRDVEGKRVLVKLADNPFTKRARTFFGHADAHDYAVEADVLATERRRQMGDAGVVAQRYQLTLFGNSQKLEIQPWQPETKRTASIPFAWKSGAWYRMKLRVENLPDGKARARGKVWPAGEAEPDAWTIERVDPIPNREGSPGIYADAPFEVLFDNIKVSSNQ